MLQRSKAYLPVALLSLASTGAFAAAKGEDPIQVDGSGAVLFGVIVAVLIVAFLGMMWVNSRKKAEEKEGEKF